MARRSRQSRLRQAPGRRSGRAAQATPPFALTLPRDARDAPPTRPRAGPSSLGLSVLGSAGIGLLPGARSGRHRSDRSTNDSLPTATAAGRRTDPAANASSTSRTPGQQVDAPPAAGRPAEAQAGSAEQVSARAEQSILEVGGSPAPRATAAAPAQGSPGNGSPGQNGGTAQQAAQARQTGSAKSEAAAPRRWCRS